jgi:hypothetical protein
MNGAIMKTLFHTSLKLAAVSLVLVCAGATAAKAQGARLQLSHLDYLAAKASETVDVNVDERLMQLTAKVFSDKDSDEAAIKELVKGLKGIYVKSFEFEHEGEYSTADVESIRSQLRGPGWSRILSVNSKKDGDVEVYLMTNGDQIGGLAVLATDPKELTVVNIIGPIDLDKLSKLEGQFGVPDLGIEQPTKPKPKN